MKGPNSVTREASPTTGTAGSTPGTSSPRHDSGLRDGLRSMTYEQGAAALAPVQMHGGGGGGKSGSGGERISGRATDRAIRKHIKVHVQEAKKGTRIAGNFEVCDEATWEEAVKTEFEDDWEAYLPANGFVSFKGPKPKA